MIVKPNPGHVNLGGLLMDRYDTWRYVELEDIRLDGTIRPYALKFEGHELPLHWLVEFNSEWPPLSIGFFVFTVTGDEVRSAPNSEKGFHLDEEGSEVDFGLLHQPPFFPVIQHDIAPWVLRKGELLGLIDVHLENSHH